MQTLVGKPLRREFDRSLREIDAAKTLRAGTRPQRMVGSHADPNLKHIFFDPFVAFGEIENIGLMFVALTRLHSEIKSAVGRDRMQLPATLGIPMSLNSVFQLRVCCHDPIPPRDAINAPARPVDA